MRASIEIRPLSEKQHTGGGFEMIFLFGILKHMVFLPPGSRREPDSRYCHCCCFFNVIVAAFSMSPVGSSFGSLCLSIGTRLLPSQWLPIAAIVIVAAFSMREALWAPIGSKPMTMSNKALCRIKLFVE